MRIDFTCDGCGAELVAGRDQKTEKPRASRCRGLYWIEQDDRNNGNRRRIQGDDMRLRLLTLAVLAAGCGREIPENPRVESVSTNPANTTFTLMP